MTRSGVCARGLLNVSAPAYAGGRVSDSKGKSLFIARSSIEQFFRRHTTVYFWTFSEPGRPDENYWSKDEAEAHFKPFRDLCSRRGYEILVVWERQKRGAWHPHCLVSGFFNVLWLRPWMVARGWGQQMRVDRIQQREVHNSARDGRGQWRPTWEGGGSIVRYLTKYLSKGFREPFALKKKCFSGTSASKCGTTRFAWAPWEKPGAYLWASGLELFSILYGRPPSFKDVGSVIRCGVEATDWASVDPLWAFGFP
jgi:hypothetical protein